MQGNVGFRIVADGTSARRLQGGGLLKWAEPWCVSVSVCVCPPTRPEDTKVSFQVSGLVTGSRTHLVLEHLVTVSASTARLLPRPSFSIMHFSGSSLIFTAESGLQRKTAFQCKRKDLSKAKGDVCCFKLNGNREIGNPAQGLASWGFGIFCEGHWGRTFQEILSDKIKTHLDSCLLPFLCTMGVGILPHS